MSHLRAFKSPQLANYLANYAEPEARLLRDNRSHPHNIRWAAMAHDCRWQGCLVIPAFDEPVEGLQKQIQSIADDQVLMILVINAPENAHQEALERTQELYEQMTTEQHRHVLIVDRISTPRRIHPKQGVGMARKIGTDLALALIEQGRIRSPWILQSDADVVFLSLIHI